MFSIQRNKRMNELKQRMCIYYHLIVTSILYYVSKCMQDFTVLLLSNLLFKIVEVLQNANYYLRIVTVILIKQLVSVAVY